MANSTADSSSGSTADRKRHSKLVDFLIRLGREKPLGAAGAVTILLLLFIAIFANFLAPYGMNEGHMEDYLSPTSATHWLGTDNLGRDLLSRVIFGARISVIVGLATAAIATFLSVIIGLLSGYFGGKFDLILQRFVDAWMSFPSIIILMILMSILGTGIWQVIAVLGLVMGITGSRIIRGAVMSVKENMYVQAAVAIGCPTSRILIRHILPNVTAPVIILFTTRVPDSILLEAALSFLGFGIPPPTPSWGSMLSGSGRGYMFLAPWIAIWPGLALAITVYSVNMFGDALRDLLDPRLRGGMGRYGVRVKKKSRRKSVSIQKS